MIKVMWHTIGNMISLDIDFYIIYFIYLFEQGSTLLYRQRYRFKWKNVVQHMWLKRHISTH